MKESTKQVRELTNSSIYRAARYYSIACKRHGDDIVKIAQCIDGMSRSVSDDLWHAWCLAETRTARAMVREARGLCAGYELKAMAMLRPIAR